MFQQKSYKKGIAIERVSLTLFFCLFASVCFAANSKPLVGSITPASGTSNPYQQVTFTTTYTDANGWQDIRYAYLLVNSSTGKTNCLYGYYNRVTNQLFLRNSANSAWLGGFNPGSSNIIENNQVKLNCAQTSILGSGNTLTITWSITFKSTFTGLKNTYLYVKDNANAHQGWVKKGTWRINPNSAPTVGTISPANAVSTVNAPLNLTATYSDPNTWEDIQLAYLLINTSTALSKCFYGYYNQNTNLLYLRNDANTAWLGGYSPGSNNTIENSYCKLNPASTTVSGSGNTLTVNWSITFKSTFTGTKNIYLYVKDDANAYQGWVKKGTIIIQNQIVDTTPPQITGLTPLDGSTFLENDTVLISPTVNDIDPSPLEYQFSIDGLIKQAWSGTSRYSWNALGGKHTLKIEVRDTGGQDTKEAKVYIFRRPIGPP